MKLINYRQRATFYKKCETACNILPWMIIWNSVPSREIAFLPGGVLHRCSLELLRITSVKSNEFPCSDIKAVEIRQQQQQPPVPGTRTPPRTSTSNSVSTQFPGSRSQSAGRCLLVESVENKPSDGLWLVRCAGSAAVTWQQKPDTFSRCPALQI